MVRAARALASLAITRRTTVGPGRDVGVFEQSQPKRTVAVMKGDAVRSPHIAPRSETKCVSAVELSR
jgi:hypothetical protein